MRAELDRPDRSPPDGDACAPGHRFVPRGNPAVALPDQALGRDRARLAAEVASELDRHAAHDERVVLVVPPGEAAPAAALWGADVAARTGARTSGAPDARAAAAQAVGRAIGGERPVVVLVGAAALLEALPVLHEVVAPRRNATDGRERLAVKVVVLDDPDADALRRPLPWEAAALLPGMALTLPTGGRPCGLDLGPVLSSPQAGLVWVSTLAALRPGADPTPPGADPPAGGPGEVGSAAGGSVVLLWGLAARALSPRSQVRLRRRGAVVVVADSPGPHPAMDPEVAAVLRRASGAPREGTSGSPSRAGAAGGTLDVLVADVSPHPSGLVGTWCAVTPPATRWTHVHVHCQDLPHPDGPWDAVEHRLLTALARADPALGPIAGSDDPSDSPEVLP